MAKSDKRARKRENKQIAREARVEATKRAKRRKSTRSTAIIGAVLVIGVIALSVIRSGNAEACTKDEPKASKRQTYETAPAMTIDPAKKYTATIKTSCGDIVVALDPKAAPQAVNSFVFLAREQFFDGLTWHRVVTDFVIQAGSPDGSGSDGPGYSFEDELPTGDGYAPGSLAMANSGPNTNGSQFFIVTAKEKRDIANNGHTLFGKVTEGLDVAREIESFAPESESRDGPPTRPIYIVSVRITESAP